MVGTKCGLSTGRRPSAAAEVLPSMAVCGGRAVASAAAESSGCSCVVTCCSYSSHPQQARCDPMAAGFVGRSRLGCVGARASRRAHNNCCAVDSAVVGGCRRQQLRQHLRQQPSSSSLHGWQNQLRRCIQVPPTSNRGGRPAAGCGGPAGAAAVVQPHGGLAASELASKEWAGAHLWCRLLESSFWLRSRGCVHECRPHLRCRLSNLDSWTSPDDRRALACGCVCSVTVGRGVVSAGQSVHLRRRGEGGCRWRR